MSLEVKSEIFVKNKNEEELCESMAGMIKENYQTLQMGLIMSYLRKKFDEDEEDCNGKNKN